jgi:hypothetical protein
MPRMSRAALLAVKVRWQAKRNFRLRRWRYWRRRPKQTAKTVALRRKWWGLYQESERVLKRVNASYAAKAPVDKPGRAIAFGKHYIGVHESPAGSNRGPLIDRWQARFGFRGAPWCGLFLGNELLAGGVHGVTSRIASVSAIEDDARAHRGCFVGWTPGFGQHARRGDGVVLFGRGIHVELIVEVLNGAYVTIGGNTSASKAGNQSAGGCVAEHIRSAGEVHGVAHVRY